MMGNGIQAFYGLASCGELLECQRRAKSDWRLNDLDGHETTVVRETSNNAFERMCDTLSVQYGEHGVKIDESAADRMLNMIRRQGDCEDGEGDQIERPLCFYRSYS